MPVTRIPSPTKAATQLSDELRLLRYMPFPRFLTLMDGWLTFTPLRLLRSSNDPLESRPITQPNVVFKELQELENHEAVFDRLVATSNKWVQAVMKSPASDRDRNHYFAKSFHTLIDETRAVSCWFANDFESAAMWASFAPQGVAIELDLIGLERALPDDREFLVAAVRYRNRDKFKIGTDNADKFPHMVLRPYLMKGREFAHEREVRIVTRCERDREWFRVRTREIFKSVRRIIISPYVDPDSTSGLKKHIESTLEIHFPGKRAAPPVEFSSINKRYLEERKSLEVRKVRSRAARLTYDSEFVENELPL